MIALTNLLESYYISIFTNGLKGEIKSMVKMIKLTSLTRAFKISLLQETTIALLNKSNKLYKLFNTKRTLELYFMCDEKYSPGNKCKNRRFKFIVVEKDDYRSEDEGKSKRSSEGTGKEEEDM
ncbi:Uncharacterized protein Adt_11320 [Abeliophyllum distichum]|uniref:Uncharacterized protein n=1 Tax=Abeliophyllum distichum TaxID=126358 RepID=A0ABD1UMU3_9LAMI